VDEKNPKITEAVRFYKKYLSEFRGYQVPDYTEYWSKNDCERFKTPDPIVYSISSGYPTYNFGVQKSIFYAREYPEFVHLKTMMTQMDSLNNLSVYAITNHYIAVNDSNLHFIRPVDANSDLYRTVTNGDITYHFLKNHTFNKAKSDSLLRVVKQFESDWSFDPLKVNYYFTETQDELGFIRGLDYYYGMEQSYPSGMSFPGDGVVYCNGYGEGNFHEILHLYLNPLYVKSPVNHGLIYYLGGGLGTSFDALINKMNAYLIEYPDTDLSEFETLMTKDITLHINHTVTGLLCKLIDEKDGQKGLQRLLNYDDMTILFQKEFGLEKPQWNEFLKTNFKKYQSKE
jgi:hypothetical protein